MKRRILTLASLSLLALFVLTTRTGAQPGESIGAPKRKPLVILTIDYADGAQKRFPLIPWKKSMNVLDAIQWADDHPRGIDFAKRGRGETTLLTQIDDLKNRGGGRKNWIFRVNGKMGDRSCAVFPIEPGDTILWKFQRYQ